MRPRSWRGRRRRGWPSRSRSPRAWTAARQYNVGSPRWSATPSTFSSAGMMPTSTWCGRPCQQPASASAARSWRPTQSERHKGALASHENRDAVAQRHLRGVHRLARPEAAGEREAVVGTCSARRIRSTPRGRRASAENSPIGPAPMTSASSSGPPRRCARPRARRPRAARSARAPPSALPRRGAAPCRRGPRLARRAPRWVLAADERHPRTQVRQARRGRGGSDRSRSAGTPSRPRRGSVGPSAAGPPASTVPWNSWRGSSGGLTTAPALKYC